MIFVFDGLYEIEIKSTSICYSKKDFSDWIRELDMKLDANTTGNSSPWFRVWRAKHWHLKNHKHTRTPCREHSIEIC